MSPQDVDTRSGPERLRERTQQFALRIIKLFRNLPKTEEARAVGKQLLRSGTSVAANYRGICRARSKPDFIVKVGIVIEEADDAVFWLELLIKTVMMPEARMHDLLTEANELVSIFVVSRKTAKGVSKVN